MSKINEIRFVHLLKYNTASCCYIVYDTGTLLVDVQYIWFDELHAFRSLMPSESELFVIDYYYYHVFRIKSTLAPRCQLDDQVLILWHAAD